MSNEFVSVEVDKIMKQENLSFPKNMAMASAWICGNFKGLNLKVLDVHKTSSLSDYFVLASATNLTQAHAMADTILTNMRRHGYEALSKEGIRDSDWLLLDLGDILIHIFLDSSRDVYGLDDLWASATKVEIPQEYYFSSDESEEASGAPSGRSFF